MTVVAKILRRDQGLRVKRVAISPQPGAQANFLYCMAAYIGFFSGFGGGKTWAGASKAVKNCINDFRGWDGLIVAPSYGDLETFVVPEILTRFAQVGIKAYYKASSPPFIHYRIKVDGAWQRHKIHLRSGAHPESIVGFAVAWCWIDEAARIPKGKTPVKDVKTQCIARMRGIGLKQGQMFITTTHEGEMTWVCEDFITKAKTGHVHFRSSTFDNRYMIDYANGLLEQYDPKLVQQYVNGEPVNLAGQLVYWGFDRVAYPAGNVDSSITLDWTKPVVLTMDFNAAPGMHACIGQYHPERDEFWIVHELHKLGMHVPAMIAEYATLLGGRKKKVFTHIHGDSTSNSRDAATGETGYFWVRREMASHGMVMADKVAKCNPAVADRIIAANSAFQDGKGRHVKVHPRCKVLMRDLCSVQRDERGRIDKTQEVRGLTHMSDALTYWIYDKRPIHKTQISNMSYTRSA